MMLHNLSCTQISRKNKAAIFYLVYCIYRNAPLAAGASYPMIQFLIIRVYQRLLHLGLTEGRLPSREEIEGIIEDRFKFSFQKGNPKKSFYFRHDIRGRHNYLRICVQERLWWLFPAGAAVR